MWAHCVAGTDGAARSSRSRTRWIDRLRCDRLDLAVSTADFGVAMPAGTVIYCFVTSMTGACGDSPLIERSRNRPACPSVMHVSASGCWRALRRPLENTAEQQCTRGSRRARVGCGPCRLCDC
eukprot:3393194-Prymnesium_polylepis.1